ncbi:long-chain-fatty-acid--CoA ligase [Malassezia cuniculi]|uniref:Long-chain-fatty-acid--CoA ligase n=1 Tax=Malassezia cuniculi TaxID=948313 RepID=A0AAF0JAV3_9BASI|nr:long-chain-fatty-acid--CoA ligase [Malassezia cuniculi]
MVANKASVVLNPGSAPKGEGDIHRSVLSPNKLLERPNDEVHTMRDVLLYARKDHGEKKQFAYRDIIREINEDKVIKKNVGGEVVEETKTWTFYELTPYKYMTLNEFCDRVDIISRGFNALGIESHSRFNIFASTSITWQMIAQSCFTCGITFCTAYDTLGPSGLKVSLAEPGVAALFTNAAQLHVVENIIDEVPTLRVIIYDGEADPKEIESIKQKLSGRQNPAVVTLDELMEIGKTGTPPQSAPRPEDIACIMYTSGSTGAPKGVILTHANLVATVAGVELLLRNYVKPEDSILCFLPLAHILEFVVECFVIFRGTSLGYGRVKTLTATNVRNCQGDLMEYRPTLFVGVPAVWELIRKGMLAKVRQSSALRQRVFRMSMWSKRNNVPVLRKLADEVVFKQVRAQTGGRLRLALSGGAPISRETQEFLRTCLVEIVQGYGMTESSAMCAVLTPEFFKYSCVGSPMPSVEVKLRDVPDAGYFAQGNPPQGEVLIRGPSVTQGYLNRPEVTAETFTSDGWLCTGDVGQWNSDGTLSLIDRKKNLVKLSGGEYIAIERLESIYKSVNLVSNLCVHASSDAKQPMAIVFPREDTLRHALEDAGLNDLVDKELEDQIKDKRVVSLVLKQLNAKGKSESFATMELLQTVVLIAEELPLTAAQKVQRKEVANKYADEIKKVYP